MNLTKQAQSLIVNHISTLSKGKDELIGVDAEQHYLHYLHYYRSQVAYLRLLYYILNLCVNLVISHCKNTAFK